MWVVAGDANTAVTWADRFDALPVLRMGTTLETMADMASATVTVGKAAYAGGVDYQGYSGAFRQLWRIVFENVGFVRSTGGPVFFSAYATPKAAQKYFSAHASNAALSGSQQTGADGEL